MDDDEYLGNLMERALAPVEVEKYSSLPYLIEDAKRVLDQAKSSAEILEATDKASIAYTTAKEMGRIGKARKAHDEVLDAARRLQGDALKLETRAKIRLAEEYDAAQQRGEVATGSTGRGDKIVGNHNDINPATASDLGLRRDQIHEARRFRDFEKENPNGIEAIVDELVECGQEPTKSAIKKEMYKKFDDYRVRQDQEVVKLTIDDVVTPIFSVVSTWYRDFDGKVTSDQLAEEAWKKLSRNPDLRSPEQMAEELVRLKQFQQVYAEMINNLDTIIEQAQPKLKLVN